jgi:hypothetical protein
MVLLNGFLYPPPVTTGEFRPAGIIFSDFFLSTRSSCRFDIQIQRIENHYIPIGYTSSQIISVAERLPGTNSVFLECNLALPSVGMNRPSASSGLSDSVLAINLEHGPPKNGK